MIASLLGSLTPAAFLEDYFLKLPLAMAGGCPHLTALGSWDVVEHLLVQPGVDVLVGMQGQAGPGDTPRPDEARGLLDRGYTIGIRHAEKHHDGLAELAAEFAADFAAPVDLHLYMTPAGQAGFGWHYDAEDVFILQTAGSKQWSLRKNTVNPWPLVESIPQDMRYQAEIMPLTRCTLAAGDWLYIPAGYWHSTAAGEESISLSVGLMTSTAIHLLDALRRKLLGSLRWRQRLPVSGRVSPSNEEELLDQYRTIAADLARDFARELCEERFLSRWLNELRNPQSELRTPLTRPEPDRLR